MIMGQYRSQLWDKCYVFTPMSLKTRHNSFYFFYPLSSLWISAILPPNTLSFDPALSALLQLLLTPLAFSLPLTLSVFYHLKVPLFSYIPWPPHTYTLPLPRLYFFLYTIIHSLTSFNQYSTILKASLLFTFCYLSHTLTSTLKNPLLHTTIDFPLTLTSTLPLSISILCTFIQSPSYI